ncbi:MAG: hypothetical protein JSW07_20360 [bacterium]|nr:MAG: hypothetical protein JSW07_20360 [bacterium]
MEALKSIITIKDGSISLILLILAFLLINSNTWSQEESEPKIELSRKTFGLNIGTGFFQSVNINLTNFQQEILTTSDNLIPINFKANFNYYFTPNLAIRFSSGYGFSQQKSKNEIDYSEIHSRDAIVKNESLFTVTGFPAEAALIFQTPVDVRATMFLHFGIGFGYYAYNYQAEGTLKEYESKTRVLTLEENYVNPAMTLSGGAQFFILGFDISITPIIGTTLEVSKVGWSMMKFTRDEIKQENKPGDVNYDKKYGYEQQDYTGRNGFDDLAVSLGIFWQL